VAESPRASRSDAEIRVRKVGVALALAALGAVVVVTYGGVLPWSEIGAVLLAGAVVGAAVARLLTPRYAPVVMVASWFAGMAVVALVLDRRDWVALYLFGHLFGMAVAGRRSPRQEPSRQDR
jgi:hypothetical protein